MSNHIELRGVLNPNANNKTHTPSKIQADTLFTFTERLEYLVNYLRASALYPRYCVENIEYLGIDGIERIAIPMKCFCDITLHRLGSHLEWYGYYGLAFSKEWGMGKGMQPVQYINPNSFLCNDFSESFNAALKADFKNESEAQKKLKTFLLEQLMFYKPYDGMMENRCTRERGKKCFTDECEWRFVADMSSTDYNQVYYDNAILTNNLSKISDSIELDNNLRINFNYDDIKYIIIKEDDDFDLLMAEINKLGLPSEIANRLISKIIIWDKSKEDF